MPMHLAIHLLVLSLFITTGHFSNAAEEGNSRWAPAEGKCPFGHENLRNIPIVYGLLVEGDNKKVERLEVWLGGCCVGSDRMKLVCSKCRYAFETTLKLWGKHSEDCRDFEIPLQEFLTKIPVPKQARSRVLYSQTVTGTGSVVEEQISYWQNSGDVDSVEWAVSYFKQLDVKYDCPKEEVRAKGNRKAVIATIDGKTITVAVECGNAEGQDYVTATLVNRKTLDQKKP